MYTLVITFVNKNVDLLLENEAFRAGNGCIYFLDIFF
jgi:hypothetical protein